MKSVRYQLSLDERDQLSLDERDHLSLDERACIPSLVIVS